MVNAQKQFFPRLLDGVAVLAVLALVWGPVSVLVGVTELRASGLNMPFSPIPWIAAGIFPAVYLVIFEVLRRETAQEKVFGLIAWPATMFLTALFLLAMLIPLRMTMAMAGAIGIIGPVGMLAMQGFCLLVVLGWRNRFLGREDVTGLKNGMDPDDPWADELPDELAGWNWAAMCTAPFWAFSHRSRKGLFLFTIPVLNLFAPLIIGSRANRWAWDNGMVGDVDDYLAKQRSWMLRYGWALPLGMLLAFVL